MLILTAELTSTSCILIRLQVGFLGPVELQTSSHRTAAKVLDAYLHKFSVGEWVAFRRKDKPNLILID